MHNDYYCSCLICLKCEHVVEFLSFSFERLCTVAFGIRWKISLIQSNEGFSKVWILGNIYINFNKFVRLNCWKWDENHTISPIAYYQRIHTLAWYSDIEKESLENVFPHGRVLITFLGVNDFFWESFPLGRCLQNEALKIRQILWSIFVSPLCIFTNIKMQEYINLSVVHVPWEGV